MIYMLFYLALLLTINSVSSLQCHQCSAVGCQTVNCSSGQMCVSAVVKVENFSVPFSQVSSCVPALACPAVGPQIFSFDFGHSSVLVNAHCCNTDLCNSNTPNVTVPPPGGLRCHGCNPETNQCSSVTCNSAETQCFSAQVRVTPSSPVTGAFGCATPNMCNPAVLSILPLVSWTVPSGAVSCCGSSYCNAPPRSSQAPPTTAGRSVFDNSAPVVQELSLLCLLGALLLTLTI